MRLRLLLLGAELFEEGARSANWEAVCKLDQMPIARDELGAIARGDVFSKLRVGASPPELGEEQF